MTTENAVVAQGRASIWVLRQQVAVAGAMIAAFSCLLLGAQVAVAAPGDLDGSFGDNGFVVDDYGVAAVDVALQSNGKFLVASAQLARYEADGDLDPSFGGGDGLAETEIGGTQFEAAAVQLQEDGKVLVAGTALFPLGEEEFGEEQYDENFAVARYDADGTPDTSFGGDGLVTIDFGTELDWVEDLAIQSDGKPVVFGGTLGGEFDLALARLNSDGSLDTSFSGDGKVVTDFGGDDYPKGLALAPGDKPVVAERNTGDDESGFTIARYTTAGSLDSSFGGGDGVVSNFNVNRIPNDVAVQPDGKIIAAGTWAGEEFALTRYEVDGSLDPTFGGGYGSVDHDFPGYDGGAFAVSLEVEPDGRIVAAGGAYDEAFFHDDFALARYNPNGTLDSSFGGDGMATADPGEGGFNNYAHSLVRQPDGKLLAAGSTGEEDNDVALARFVGGGGPIPTHHRLTVSRTGSGDGAVDGPGITCGETCEADYLEGEVVGLEAKQLQGSEFAGWVSVSGDPGTCEGTIASCEVTMSADVELRAVFDSDTSDGGEESPERPDEGDESPSGDDREPPEQGRPRPIPPRRQGTAFSAGIGLVRGNVVYLRSRCTGDTVCRGIVRLLRRVRVGAGRGAGRVLALSVGVGRYAIAPGRRGVIRMRLTRPGVFRLLRRTGPRGLPAILVGRSVKNRVVRLRRVSAPRRAGRSAVGGLRQRCLKLGLAMPNVNARMVRPGNDGGLPQAVYIDLVYRHANAFTETCRGKFAQVRQVLVQMRTKNRKAWINMSKGGRLTKRKLWKTIRRLDEDGADTYDITPAGHPKEKLWNRTCRPVRAFIRNKVLSADKKRVWVKGGNGRKGRWVVRYPIVGQRTTLEAVRLGGRCK